MSEHEDRPRVDVEMLRKVAVRLDEFTRLGGGSIEASPGEDIRSLLAKYAALVEEVERLRGAASDIERLSDTYTQEGADIVMRRILDLRNERDEAIERATKAEREVERLREDRLQMLAHTGRVVGQRDAARNERDEAQAVIADVRELAKKWARSLRNPDPRSAWSGAAILRDLLALLPDETGDDRG